MNKIAPASGKSVSLAARKKMLTQALYDELQSCVELSDGSLCTKMQAVATGLIEIAINAESATDRIAATKVLWDRLEGKAAVQQEQNIQEMPKIQIVIGDASSKQLEEQANQILTPEENEHFMMEVSDDDGANKEVYAL